VNLIVQPAVEDEKGETKREREGGENDNWP
jgi:hypothetical protein